VGLIWGIGAAFWELFKLNRRMARRDAEELKRLEQDRPDDQDPHGRG